ncbi:MAG: Bax inhibitor-1/YccA family protein [Nocardioidaceae bacterium]
MQSRNPILNNSETFNGRAAANYGHPSYPAAGQGYRGYGQGQPPVGAPPQTWQYPSDADLQERMTIDSVVSRTAISLFLVVITAAFTWVFLPAELVRTAWIGGALVGAGVGLVLSFKRVVSPALVVVYAVAEGFFLGAASEAFEQLFPGIVAQAVVGTLAAFVATLAAYKFFNISVSSTFRKWVSIVGLGFFVVVLGDFLLAQFGQAIGFNNFGTLGLVMSFLGLGLGVLYLILDFDMVERGVAAGALESESWRAAFALTAALILIYVEILRILAIFRN